MLIELPVILTDEQSGVSIQVPGTFKVSNIETVIKGVAPEKCEVHTIGGDILEINLSYEHMIKYWHDALEILSGVFVTKRMENNVNLN